MWGGVGVAWGLEKQGRREERERDNDGSALVREKLERR